MKFQNRVAAGTPGTGVWGVRVIPANHIVLVGNSVNTGHGKPCHSASLAGRRRGGESDRFRYDSEVGHRQKALIHRRHGS